MRLIFRKILHSLLVFIALISFTCGILVPETQVYKVYSVKGQNVEHYLTNEENFIGWDCPLEIEFNNYKEGGKFHGNVKFAKLGWERINNSRKIDNGFYVYTGGRIYRGVFYIMFSHLNFDGTVLKGYYKLIDETADINTELFGWSFYAVRMK